MQSCMRICAYVYMSRLILKMCESACEVAADMTCGDHSPHAHPHVLPPHLLLGVGGRVKEKQRWSAAELDQNGNGPNNKTRGPNREAGTSRVRGLPSHRMLT